MRNSPPRPNRASRTGRPVHPTVIARVLVAWLLAGLASPALAQTTWTGTDGDWFTASNWDTNSIPINTDNAFVANGATVTLDSDGARASFVYIGAGTGKTGHLVIDNASDARFSGLVLGAPDGTGILDIRNGAQVTATGLYLGDDGAGGAGTGTVTVSGAGTILTTSAISQIIGLRGSGTLTISDGAMVDTGGRPVYIGNTGAAGVLNIGAGGIPGVLAAAFVSSLGGSATLNFNHTDSAYYFTTTGASGGASIPIVNGGVAVRQVGTGTTILTGANTYTGGTTVSAGALQIGAGGTAGVLPGNVTNDATLAFNRSNNLTYSGIISGSGSVSQLGGGTLTLSGANTYASGTQLSAGTVSVGDNGNLGNAAGGLTFDGGTLLASTGFATSRATVLNAGGGTFTVSVGTLTHSGDISGAGELSMAGAGTLLLSGTNTWSGGTTVTAGTLQQGLPGAFVSNTNYTVNGGTLDLNDNALTVSALAGTGGTVDLGSATIGVDQDTNTSYTGVITGTGGMTKQGTGSLTLAGANTYTGGTRLVAGTVSVSGDGNLGNAAGGLTFDGGTLLTTAGFTTNRDAVLNAGGGTVTVSVGTLTQSGDFSGTGGLTKAGAGTLLLSGTNTWSGGTTVAAGTLQQGLPGAFVSNTNYTVNGGTLDLNDHSLAIGALAGTGGTVDLASALLTLDQATDTSFDGVIIGTGGLSKSGTGTLTLTGANTYSGTTQVSGGALVVTGSLADSSTTVATGSTLGGNGTVGDVTSSGTIAPGTSAGTLSTGALTLQGTATLDYELDTPGVVGGGVNDLIAVTGDLTLDGTLAIIDLGGFGVGNYTLMTYSGTLTDSGLTLPAAPAGLSYSLVSGGGAVVLAVSAVHDLTYSAGANGSLTGATSQSVVNGNDGTAVTAVPDINYSFKQWSDGSTANPRTDTNVTGPVTVTAQFVIDKYTLAYGAGANGSLTGTTNQLVNHGNDGTAVTAVPDTNYSFTQWSDGSTANPRTDTNVTGPVTVTAQFALNSYTLDYGAGANGTVTGITAQTVSHGGNGTAVTAVPAAESAFIQWSDGRTDNPRTDLNVTGNIGVTALFSDPVIGTVPVADAGDDITLVSPDDELVLFFDGSGSTDAEDTDDELDHRWALDNQVIASGPTLALTLANGRTHLLALIVGDSDGNVDYDLVRVTLHYPNEWAYHGATPDPGLGLGLNNIGLFDSSNGLVFTCAAAYHNDGNRINDRSFAITLALQAQNGFGENQEMALVDIRRFNPDNALTADGEVPDCSGRFYPDLLLFEDYLTADGETGFYTLELIDLENIVFRVSGYQALESE